MPSIDFDLFKTEVDLFTVIKALRMDVGRLNPLWKRSPCPFCKHADFRCLNVKWDDDLWHCHRCNKGGSQVDFAMYALGIDAAKAVEIICRMLNRPCPYKPRCRTRRASRRDRTGELIDDDEDDALG